MAGTCHQVPYVPRYWPISDPVLTPVEIQVSGDRIGLCHTLLDPYSKSESNGGTPKSVAVLDTYISSEHSNRTIHLEDFWRGMLEERYPAVYECNGRDQRLANALYIVEIR